MLVDSCFELWKVGIKIILDNLVLGVGFDVVLMIVCNYIVVFGDNVKVLYNLVFEILMGCGIFVFFFYILFYMILMIFVFR